MLRLPTPSYRKAIATSFFVLVVAALVSAIFLHFDSEALAISATNVQPNNLVLSNKTTVTVSFTNGVTIPTGGKVKVVFPSGYDVSSASAAACSSMNGGFSTSISGQTVTITRDGTGSSAIAAAQTCTIQNIVNPSATGSTGTYIIGLYTSIDVLLEEDVVVAADTIIAPGSLAATNVQAGNLVELVRSRYTVTFTTINTLQANGLIVVTFPAGFVVTDAAVDTATCSTMDGGFSTSILGQQVTITRNGTGTAQVAGAESCVIDGIVAPVVGLSGTYAIITKDGLGNTTDSDAAVTGDTFIAAGTLAATNVQPASLAAGASSTVTISFTTTVPMLLDAKIRVTFPAGYSLATAGTVTCASIVGTESFMVSGQVLTISRSGGSTDAAGAESCTLTTVRNPQVTGLTGVYAIEIIDNQISPALIESDMAVAADTITPGVLTATNVQPENLVANVTSLQTVTFTTVNPIPADGRIVVTFPAGFDVTAATGATCAVADGTFATSVLGQVVTITRTGTTAIAAGSAIICSIKDIRTPVGAGAGGAYALQTETSGGALVIDSAAPASDTFVVAPALTVTNVQPTSLVSTTTNDHAITFTIAQAIPAEGKVKIIYGAGFDVTAAAAGTCTGFDGTVATIVSGQTVTLARGGSSTTSVAAAKSCVIFGIKNPVALGTTGTYTITVTDKMDVTVATLATVAADTIIAAGVLTTTDVQPASLAAGAVGLVTTVFSAVNGIPTNGKIAITFPAGYDVSAASGGVCTGFTGTVTTSVLGQVVTLTRDTTSIGVTAGTISCTLFNIRNPGNAGATGVYGLATQGPAGVTISTAAPASDTLVVAALSATNIEPDTTLVSGVNQVTVTFTAPNAVPSNGKIVIGFPAGFDVTGVGASDVSCAGLSGTLTTSRAGNTLTVLRSGGSATTDATVFNCTVLDVVNPALAGSGDTYLLRTTTNAELAIAEDIAVTADTFALAGALTGTNVEPITLITSDSGATTISFTTTLGLPRDGKILITFPAGFTVSSASGGDCSTMNGNFATSVLGQVVTIVRSAGTAEPAGAQTCTLDSIVNPSTTGATGTYSIETLTATNQTIQSDTAVTADTITNPPSGGSGGGGGGGGGGGSYQPPSTVTPTEELSVEQILAERAARVATLPVAVHSLVKLANDGNPDTHVDEGVYYISADGYRHVFPNEKVYFTWYCDFSPVRIISPEQLASITFGKNITYRPGLKMVKFLSVPTVYTVSKGGILRAISSEALASALYGADWNKKIDDISDAFFGNYTFGPSINSTSDFEPLLESISVTYPSDSLGLVAYSQETSGTAFSCPTPVEQPWPYVFSTAWRFVSDVYPGSTDITTVKYLQDFLTNEGPAVYPEATVSGSYGPATTAAVKRLQSLYAIQQTGVLGPLTREVVNSIIERLAQ